jgi:phosphoserine phosphatase
MKLVVFDMDGTLLNGRTILFLAKKFGFYEDAIEALERLDKRSERSKTLARMLKGIDFNEFMEVVKNIPLMKGAENTVNYLRKRGVKTAIVTDSYDVVAEFYRKRLGIDRAIGIRLIIENGLVTGKIEMPLNCRSNEECGHPSICKKQIMRELAADFGIKISDTVAIGDNWVDICMVREAGIGIAFNPKTEELRKDADVVVDDEDLQKVLQYIPINNQ